MFHGSSFIFMKEGFDKSSLVLQMANFKFCVFENIIRTNRLYFSFLGSRKTGRVLPMSERRVPDSRSLDPSQADYLLGEGNRS